MTHFLKAFKCQEIKESSEVRNSLSLPLVCKLLKDNPTYRLPEGCYDSEMLISKMTHSELNIMVTKHPGRYLALLLVLANKNCFIPSMHATTLSGKVRKLVDRFSVSIPSINAFIQQLSDILGELEGAYLILENGSYMFKSEPFYNMFVLHAGVECPSAILKYCSSKFLGDHIHIEGCNHSRHIVVLERTLLREWMERVSLEIENGNSYDVFFGKSFCCNIEHFIRNLRYLSATDIFDILVSVAKSDEIKKIASLFSSSKIPSDVPTHIWFGTIAIASLPEVKVFHMLLVLGDYQIFELAWKILKSRNDLKTIFDDSDILGLSIIGGNVSIVRAITTYVMSHSNPVQKLSQMFYKKVLKRNPKFPMSALAAPLCLSSMCNHLELTKELISRGCNVNEIDAGKNTPLIHAAKYGYSDILNLFLSYGADINKLNRHRKSAILYSVDSLTDFCALANAADKQVLFESTHGGETILMKVCDVGNIEVTRELLKYSKSFLRNDRSITDFINYRKENGVTALFQSMSV